jgi:malate/lactate dehydrogenase
MRPKITIVGAGFVGSTAAHWIAVLPLAATEQHGPHLPVGTDVMIAEAYLARQIKFDSDIWIVEVEDRAGRNFLDTVVA